MISAYENMDPGSTVFGISFEEVGDGYTLRADSSSIPSSVQPYSPESECFFSLVLAKVPVSALGLVSMSFAVRQRMFCTTVSALFNYSARFGFNLRFRSV